MALARGGATAISVANRTRARAEELAQEFSNHFPGTAFATFSLSAEDLEIALVGVDLVVITSALGLKGEDFPHFPWSHVAPSCCIYDLVFRRGGTP